MGEAGREVLVLASDCIDVEIFFSYQMTVEIDCKELLNEVLVKKTRTKEEMRRSLRAKLTEAMDCRSLNLFCKPLHVRMANTAFDWNEACCDDFPADVFSGTLWTVE